MFRNVLLCILLTNTFVYASDGFISAKEGIQVLSLDGVSKVFIGTPVKTLKVEGDATEIVIEGYSDPEKKELLFSNNSKRIVIAQSPHIQQKGEKGTLKMAIATSSIVKSKNSAWKKSEDLYFSKCTQCHAANEPDGHTMIEWEGLIASMEQFAQPSAQEKEMLLHFLKSHAKDAIQK